MEFNLRKSGSFVELSVFNSDATIKEDIYGVVPEVQIEEFITVAREMANHNGMSDVDFVYKIFDAFLNESEREDFLKRTTTI